MDAVALYEEARARDTALAGFYNRNVRVEGDGGPFLVRIPGAETETMDLTLWPESALLEAIGPHLSPAPHASPDPHMSPGPYALAPRLVHANADPAFQIHEFVEGRRVDELAPDGKPLPEPVLDGIVRLLGALLAVPVAALPAVPADWPADGDSPAFAERLLALVRAIRGRADERVEGLYRALGVPVDPCSRLARSADVVLVQRPFRLLHADLHRKNMILTEGGQVVFLDWELALWGDPVYELADHLHKMAYTQADRQRVTAGWESAAPPECLAGWREGLAFYLGYEEMKSAVVDTVRWARRIAVAQGDRERRILAAELHAKLLAAAPHWDGGAPPEPAGIEAAVAAWLG
ncbi:phosphotransferase [Streptomyces sp. NPDC048496]|uniref:phosphotransferase n=1 Tax=Streptomyces sp. NPDC048496 TaxID=3365558 RepID=UPI003712B0ED